MRKFFIMITLVLTLTTSSYAVSVVDTMLCKKVKLRHVNKELLVNRVSGEVKYISKTSGGWLLLKGSLKKRYQALYDAQRHHH